jgi:hypothetical protein
VVGALQIMLTALVSQAQNALENSGHIPAILKATIHDAPPKAVTNVIPVAPPDV